jgi:hypothetical protein
MKLSKRKLESYRRAEIVAQASRLMMVSNANLRDPKLVDLWTGAMLDWMAVTGKMKYDTPKRRGRHR